MVPETLESRKLFSVVTASQGPGGVLTVTGSNQADTISVTEVTVPEDNPFNVPANTKVVFVFYDADGDGEASDLISAPDGNPFFQGVKSVRLIGKAGDDNLQFTGIDVGAIVQGDAGNDILNVEDDQDLNGIGTSIIFGGDGDDSIGIVHGNATLAFGEAGNDAMVANLANGGGSAILSGNNGADAFTVSGNVIAIGGAGKDTRVGFEDDPTAIVIL